MSSPALPFASPLTRPLPRLPPPLLPGSRSHDCAARAPRIPLNRRSGNPGRPHPRASRGQAGADAEAAADTGRALQRRVSLGTHPQQLHPRDCADDPSLSRRHLIGGALALASALADVAPAQAQAGTAQLGPSSLSTDDDDIASKVFEACTQSVAAVILLQRDPRTGEEEKGGTGSGIVWDKFGHIVTNYHVIARVLDDKAGTRCVVSLQRETGGSIVLDGTVIGMDPTKDLAVVKVDAVPEELSPATIGISRDLRVGQSCFAVGNPYGYLHTLTAGVVSGLGRAIPSPAGQAIPDAIQTDAAINSGNSGGPLLDSSGRVVGINTATFTRTGSGTSSGVNFAVAVDTVVKVVPKIIVYGTPTRFVNARKRDGDE